MRIQPGVAITTLCYVAIVRSQSFRLVDGIVTESNLDQGYYSFVKAEDFEHPPKVRKPPYHRSTFRCMERVVGGKLSPKDTFCGDLNKGVIPLNPMGQRPFDDPYPFNQNRVPIILSEASVMRDFVTAANFQLIRIVKQYAEAITLKEKIRKENGPLPRIYSYQQMCQ